MYIWYKSIYSTVLTYILPENLHTPATNSAIKLHPFSFHDRYDAELFILNLVWCIVKNNMENGQTTRSWWLTYLKNDIIFIYGAKHIRCGLKTTTEDPSKHYIKGRILNNCATCIFIVRGDIALFFKEPGSCFYILHSSSICKYFWILSSSRITIVVTFATSLLTI